MKYLIRHAEKTDSSMHAKLSDQGKLDAIKYGNKLSNLNIKYIITSPIERCVETSEFISVGIGCNVPIVEARELGNPGVYISDDKKAMEIFNSYSLLEIINMQLSKKPMKGFHKIDTASERLKIFFNSFSENTLFISHDAIIIPFINWINKVEQINNQDMIDYLYTYPLSS